MLYRCILNIAVILLIISNDIYALPNQTMANEVLTQINKNRLCHLMSPLKMDARISEEAYQHSLEMANHAMAFGHSGFQTRIKHIYQYIKNPGGGAENIAYNYKTAKIVVDGWMHSPGHRTNILGRGYNLTGIGIATDSKGHYYFTQIFIKAG